MTSALHKRLQRLEELLAARVAPPIWRWQTDPHADTAAELDRMVADGEVADRDKDRVQVWRWLTREEALAYGIEVPPDPPKPQPQLPGPPELKLLPAPESASPSGAAKKDVPSQPPDPGKRGPLTETQMRRMLEDRDRPFGRPIKYPVVGLA
jgi:hypothetical protein